MYKTKVGKYSEDSVGSLKWHIDNHPKEVLKAMVYLDDVEQQDAPFKGMQKRGVGLKEETHRVDHSRWQKWHSRYDREFIDEHIKKGYSERSFTGPAGSVVYFDNNVVHKASPSSGKERYVIVFMTKPSVEEIRPRISQQHTGTNYHIDTFIDPSFYGVAVSYTHLTLPTKA